MSAVSESQLEAWTALGAQVAAETTYTSIKAALSPAAFPEEARVEVFLQGSYRNHTNIRGDSDVDVVALLSTTFALGTELLSTGESTYLDGEYPSASYSIAAFETDVFRALAEYFGVANVTRGKKSIKVRGGSNRLNADVVPAIEYRLYVSSSERSLKDSFLEGIRFRASDGSWIRNFPKLHYQQGVEKNSEAATDGRYKPTLRLFKNARNAAMAKGWLAPGVAPSYFLECFLSNAANHLFYGTQQQRFDGLLEWMQQTTATGEAWDFYCQNSIVRLFGPEATQWNQEQAMLLVRGLRILNVLGT